MLTISDCSLFVRVVGQGLFTTAEITTHFEQLEALVARKRRLGATIRALIDLREASTQQTAIAEAISDKNKAIYRDPTDRVAIITASSLLKLQVKRVLADEMFGVFVSEPAALHHLSRPD